MIPGDAPVRLFSSGTQHHSATPTCFTQRPPPGWHRRPHISMPPWCRVSGMVTFFKMSRSSRNTRTFYGAWSVPRAQP